MGTAETVNGTSSGWSSVPRFVTGLEVSNRGSRFAAIRIAIASQRVKKSHDLNRNPKIRSNRCDVFTVFSFHIFRFFQITQFDSLAIRFASGS